MSTDDLRAELEARVQEKWDESLSTDPRPRFVDVEALLNDKPEVSEPVRVKIGGKEHKICFRELTREQMEKAESTAEGYIKRANDEAGLPYEHLNSILAQERVAAEKELRLIQRVALKPGTTEPAFDLAYLRSNITAKEQTQLYQKWEAWFTRERWEDREPMEDDLFDRIVEEIKKKEPEGLFLIGLDLSTLTKFLLTLGGRLEKSPTGKFTVTS